jgi:transcriptional regulator with XRE-family HTH domain/Zn-dependent peptidase ImmA (M78 family)
VSIGRRIAQRRRELNLNQTQLAEKAGLRPAAINQYESGERRPSYEALIKLAGALKVSTDYLIGSSEAGELTSDPTIKAIIKTMQCLTEEKRVKILNFAYFLINQSLSLEAPVFDDAGEYADYLLSQTGQSAPPVDIQLIAESLGIKIIETSGLEHEGILFKAPEGSIILLDEKSGSEIRKRFTIAHLLGHHIIPWHLKSAFFCRRHGTSSLKTEDVMEMEANRFAAALLMPKLHLEKEILEKRPSLEQLEQLAHKKYRVSLFALANALIEYTGKRYTLVNTGSMTIDKTFRGNRPVVETLHPHSFAAGLLSDPPAQKTSRGGYVPASYWFLDASPEEKVYEESMYNPEFGAVLTLLTAEI